VLEQSAACRRLNPATFFSVAKHACSKHRNIYIDSTPDKQHYQDRKQMVQTAHPLPYRKQVVKAINRIENYKRAITH
jgi:hypothetical protein